MVQEVQPETFVFGLAGASFLGARKVSANLTFSAGGFGLM